MCKQHLLAAVALEPELIHHLFLLRLGYSSPVEVCALSICIPLQLLKATLVVQPLVGQHLSAIHTTYRNDHRTTLGTGIAVPVTFCPLRGYLSWIFPIALTSDMPSVNLVDNINVALRKMSARIDAIPISKDTIDMDSVRKEISDAIRVAQGNIERQTQNHVNALNNRMNGLEGSLSTRTKSLEDKTAVVAALTDRVNSLEANNTALADRVKALEAINATVTALADRVKALEEAGKEKEQPSNP